MRFKVWLWRGVNRRGEIAILLLSAGVIRLGLLGRLQLYIHPRYIVFTLVMAVIGAALALASLIAVKSKKTKKPARMASLSFAGLLLAGVGFLLVQPAALSSNIAASRGINSGAAAATDGLALLFDGGENPHLTVKDWAALLARYDNPDFFAGKTATLVGFATGSENVMLVSRFVVTCCAVDARAVGVPVYMPNWQARYAPDSWVEVTGEFIANPDDSSKYKIVLQPSAVKAINQPKEPYVY